MARTGKTGADAIAKSLKHICRVIIAYSAKIHAVIDAAAAADVITADQATAAHAFIAAADGNCQIFVLIADYSGLY